MDSIFYWISKLAWLLIAPDNLLVMLLIIGTALVWRQKIKWAKRIFTILTIAVLIIGFFPVGEWLLYPLESKYQVNPKLDHVDGIIVLSGAMNATRTEIWKQTVVNGSAERMLASIVLFKKYPDAKHVFTGGSGSMTNQKHKGADAAQKLYEEQGLDTSKIIFERESRNTSENVLLTKKIVKPQAGEKWVLITTAWHMPRSVGIFCKANWSIIPFPVDFRTKPEQLLRIQWGFAAHLSNLTIGVKEWIGLIAYSLTGKSC